MTPTKTIPPWTRLPCDHCGADHQASRTTSITSERFICGDCEVHERAFAEGEASAAADIAALRTRLDDALAERDRLRAERDRLHRDLVAVRNAMLDKRDDGTATAADEHARVLADAALDAADHRRAVAERDADPTWARIKALADRVVDVDNVLAERDRLQAKVADIESRLALETESRKAAERIGDDLVEEVRACRSGIEGARDAVDRANESLTEERTVSASLRSELEVNRYSLDALRSALTQAGVTPASKGVRALAAERDRLREELAHVRELRDIALAREDATLADNDNLAADLDALRSALTEAGVTPDADGVRALFARAAKAEQERDALQAEVNLWKPTDRELEHSFDPREQCRCGSGAHPRPCPRHKKAFQHHVDSLNLGLLSGSDGLDSLESCDAAERSIRELGIARAQAEADLDALHSALAVAGVTPDADGVSELVRDAKHAKQAVRDERLRAESDIGHALFDAAAEEAVQADDDESSKHWHASEALSQASRRILNGDYDKRHAADEQRIRADERGRAERDIAAFLKGSALTMTEQSSARGAMGYASLLIAASDYPKADPQPAAPLDEPAIREDERDEYVDNLWRKRPVVVTARRIRAPFAVSTLEGEMHGRAGDWCITGVKGEKYPCADAVFRLTYEPAGASRDTNEPPAADARLHEVDPPERRPDPIFADEQAMACVAVLVSRGHSSESVRALMSAMPACEVDTRDSDADSDWPLPSPLLVWHADDGDGHGWYVGHPTVLGGEGDRCAWLRGGTDTTRCGGSLAYFFPTLPGLMRARNLAAQRKAAKGGERP